MPTFCRHNRFIERCPICSKTLPGADAADKPERRRRSSGSATGSTRAPRGARPAGSGSLRVRRETRALDDGYRCELVPGLRSSADAERLAQETAFAAARLGLLATEPPGAYGQARALGAGGDPEQALWICFLCAYLCPLEGEDPFAGVRQVLERVPRPGAVTAAAGALDGVPLGPRSSHEEQRGVATLLAYGEWVARVGGTEGTALGAFTGDEGWGGERRFERIYERLKLAGLTRAARYDLLVTIGRLGLLDMRADRLHFGDAPRSAPGDQTTLAAKRVFGIGEELLLERRAAALAEASVVPIEALDPALANWGTGERTSLGVPADAGDPGTLERVREALEL
jgi:hypothetical protein